MCIAASLSKESKIIEPLPGMEYRIHSLFGDDFNLVVWRVFVRLQNLNNPNVVL